MNNNHHFILNCKKALNILALYYNFHSIPPVEKFLLSPIKNSTIQGQILFEELDSEIFMGIQFAQSIHKSVQENFVLTSHEVSVIAEELSHFKFLADLVEQEKQTNLLAVETLGEIDRFLCLMHWNNLQDNLGKLNTQWKNIHQICDLVFTGDRFHSENKELYIQAENLAFKHLKVAFHEQWDNSYFNFASVNKSAKYYLSSLRAQLLAG